MVPLFRHAALAAAVVLLGACSSFSPTQLIDAAGSLAGVKGTLAGRVLAPADQVAVVAVGAGHYDLLARSDEKGVANARVAVTGLATRTAVGSAVTDGQGSFSLEVPVGTYALSATVPLKEDGQTAVMTGIAVVTPAPLPYELDASMNLLASKLIQQGATTLDPAKFIEALALMKADLEKVSATPLPANQIEAAAKFDEVASETLKATVAEMK